MIEDQLATNYLQIIACGCPPTRDVGELVRLAEGEGWEPYITLTPSATKWAPIDALEERTGYPVRSQYRGADEEKTVPECDAIMLCPATVNTINKWAAGISDTLALGALVEAIGRNVPIVAVPYSNPAHMAHPALQRNLRDLTTWGVHIVRLGPDKMTSSAWRTDVGDHGSAGSPWHTAMDALDGSPPPCCRT